MDEIDNDADGTNVDDGIDDGVVVGGGDGDGGVVVGGGDGGVDVGVGGGDGDGGVVVGGGDGDGGVIVGGGDGDGGVDEGGVGGDGGVIAGGGDGDGDGVDGGVGAGDGGVDDGIGNVVIEDGAGGRIKQENRRAAKFGGLDNENEIAIDYQANVINDDKIEKEDVHLGAGVENEIEVNKSGEEIVEKDIKGEEQSQDNVASRTPRRLNFLRRGKNKIIDPLGQTTVTAGSDHCLSTCCPSVRPSVRPSYVLHFSNLAKQNNRKQWSLLAKLWVWPSGSLMTPVLSFFKFG